MEFAIPIWSPRCIRPLPPYIVSRSSIVNAGGKVCGLARPTEIRTNINGQYKLPKFATSGFLGYIRDYNPQTPYFVRSADDNRLSRETLCVTSSVPMAASN